MRAASNLLAMMPPSFALTFDQAAPLTISADSKPVAIKAGDLCTPTSGANARRNALPCGKLGAKNLRMASAASSPTTATVAAIGSKATRGDKKSKTATNVEPKTRVALKGITQAPTTKRAWLTTAARIVAAGGEPVGTITGKVSASDVLALLKTAPQFSQNLASSVTLQPHEVQYCFVISPPN